MTRREAARDWLIRTSLTYLGTPYRWGGDDPSGFDCSGLVIECLRSVDLMDRGDLSANDLFNRFRPFEAEAPETGFLIFWLSDAGSAYHVGVCLDRWHQISAGGGSKVTVTETDAWNQNAYVRIRPIPVLNPRCRFCNPLLAIKE